MLRQNVRKALTEEVLQQRALRPSSRFRPRGPHNTGALLKPEFQNREIVSEYSVGTLRESQPERLVEFRQITAVDGRPIQSVDKARRALTTGLNSSEDRIRKRMLEDFERHGLVGAVTDFGILLLMFTKHDIENFTFTPAGTTMIGTDAAVVFQYAQRAGDVGVVDFSRRKATRYPLHGQLLVRAADGLPLRLTCQIRRAEDGHDFQDQATVEYTLSNHGFVAPVSVVHRGYVDGQLTIENRFTYAPFKTFGANTEIKFTEAPDAGAGAAAHK